MSCLYEKSILDKIFEWLTSSAAPTRKIAQNLFYRLIPKKWLDAEISTTFVIMCQILEENQQHIVYQTAKSFDWSFKGWDQRLRNCLIKRAFAHENKKVIASLYQLIMQQVKLESQDLVLLKTIISTSTNLHLYKGTEDCQIGSFLERNSYLGYEILIILSNQHQAAEPLFMWLSALFRHCDWLQSDLADDSQAAIQQISRQIQQTQQPYLRSASTSLMIQILVKIQESNESHFYFKTLSRTRLNELLEKSETSNIVSLLASKQYDFDENDILVVNALNARKIALGYVFGTADLASFYRKARSAFDQKNLDASASAIRVMVELSSLGKTFDANLSVSFFEYIFCSFESDFSVDMMNNIAKLVTLCLKTLPNESMMRLTTNKINELALAAISTTDSVKTAFCMTMLTSIPNSYSVIAKVLPFAAGYSFSARPAPDVSRQIITSVWSILKEANYSDDLSPLAEEALPKLEPEGQTLVLETIKETKFTTSLLDSAWIAVNGSNERLHRMYELFLHALLRSGLTADELSCYSDKIFQIAETKNGSILPFVQAIDGSEMQIDKIPDIIVKIIFYESTRKDNEIEEKLELQAEQYLADGLIDTIVETTTKIERAENDQLRLQVMKLLKKSNNRHGFYDITRYLFHYQWDGARCHVVSFSLYSKTIKIDTITFLESFPFLIPTRWCSIS